MPTLIANRYQIVDKVGQGGMGVVYKVHDRLEGQTVALKQVMLPEHQLDFASKASTNNTQKLRLALAQEFSILASLRHPHIVSVLDYGFDHHQPFYTMTLIEGGRTIKAYATDRTAIEKYGLLSQLLQALHYLHQRGIIHRDLKPENVLVTTDGQVKVMDFGLAQADKQQSHPTGDGPLSGTLLYMAPEIIQGERASIASDLFAVGVIAYSLLLEKLPFTDNNIGTLIHKIVVEDPDYTGLAHDLVPWLQQLLAKDPSDRPANALDAIRHLADITDIPLAGESPAIRESYLQAANFVGRDAELALLSGALKRITMPTADSAEVGSAWLIGGESGIGKSRLLDELRTLALVEGMLVLRGQAVREKGTPYQIWRDILRALCLQTELSDQEASVIKALVPDIAALLERPVLDAPEIDAQAAQARLFITVESVFFRQQNPLLVILEDLQWVDEGLALLKRLSQSVQRLRLLLVGSFRDDETPNLPTELPAMRRVKLERFSEVTITALSRSILGELRTGPQIVDLLKRATEGNVFFIVEVMRALAEEAGQLEAIGQMTLPQNLFVGGMKMVVQRRLQQIPEPARPLLELAAIGGRELDLTVLGQNEANLEPWLLACANTSVLMVQENRWYFAHDKLREGLLATLSEQRVRQLHLQTAISLEKAYPNDSNQAARLAYHWREGQNPAKEAHYALIAGENALLNGANNDAIGFLERTITLYADLSVTNFQQAHVHRRLAEALSALGRQADVPGPAEKGLAYLGYPMPPSTMGIRLAIGWQAIRQLTHRFFFGLVRHNEDAMRVFEFTRIHEILVEAYFWLGEQEKTFYSALLLVNLLEKIPPDPNLSEAYILISYLAHAVGLRGLWNRYGRLARQCDTQFGVSVNRHFFFLFNGILCLEETQWNQARGYFLEGIESAKKLGHEKREHMHRQQMAFVQYIGEPIAPARIYIEESLNLAQRSGNAQYSGWYYTMQGVLYLRSGDFPESIAALMLAKTCLDQARDIQLEIYMTGYLALAHLRSGNWALARHEADEFATRFFKTFIPGHAGRHAYQAIVEVYLILWQQASTTAEKDTLHRKLLEAIAVLDAFGRNFPIARSQVDLWWGNYYALSGQLPKAIERWMASVQQAQQMGIRFDQALAHYHWGYAMAADNPERAVHLQTASTIFDALGTTWYSDQAKAAADKAQEESSGGDAT